MKKVGVIILAAGKGKRMNAGSVNKVTLSLGKKPIIVRIIDFMQQLRIDSIVVVVGHAKESVTKALKNKRVIFSEQKEQLGTGHAVQTALADLPRNITDVVVVYGDDAVFYSKKNKPYVTKMISKHLVSSSDISMLTIEQENPQGLGRIIRDRDNNLASIVEEKDASEKERKITEINPGCFIFSVEFLKKYLSEIKKSTVTNEFYLTSLVDVAIQNNIKVNAVKAGKLAWRGVNTPEELVEANKLLNMDHK